MGYSVVQICNGALTKLGVDRINDISEANKRAVLCAERYPVIRNQLLVSHPWNFAVRRVALSLLSDVPIFEFGHPFQLPVDCLRVLGAESRHIIFRIEGDKLLTDEGSIKIRYIAEETDSSKFPSAFELALELALAADLAYSLVQSDSVQMSMEKKYLMALRDARSFDAQEGTPEELYADDWINFRS